MTARDNSLEVVADASLMETSHSNEVAASKQPNSVEREATLQYISLLKFSASKL